MSPSFPFWYKKMFQAHLEIFQPSSWINHVLRNSWFLLVYWEWYLQANIWVCVSVTIGFVPFQEPWWTELKSIWRYITHSRTYTHKKRHLHILYLFLHLTVYMEICDFTLIHPIPVQHLERFVLILLSMFVKPPSVTVADLAHCTCNQPLSECTSCLTLWALIPHATLSLCMDTLLAFLRLWHPVPGCCHEWCYLQPEWVPDSHTRPWPFVWTLNAGLSLHVDTLFIPLQASFPVLGWSPSPWGAYLGDREQEEEEVYWEVFLCF